MKILFATAHFGFLRNFESGLRTLAERGHTIHLLADRRDNIGGMRTVENLAEAFPGQFTWSIAANPKTHSWRALGVGLRLSLDYWRYLGSAYDDSPALRARGAEQVPPFARPLARFPLTRFGPFRAALASVVRRIERVVPPSPHVETILRDVAPDVVVITPLLYFGSQQVEYVRTARALGIPTMLGVGSWDHLTTKGLIHEIPDRITVWNEAQRGEAARFHGVAPDLVTVTGSPAYEHWFTTTPSLNRSEFCDRVGLPADRPMLLYLCSSPFIAPHEVPFVRRWIEGIRQHADPALANASILIRPHPQNADQWKDVDLSAYGHVAIWPRAGANPVDREARLDYYHSMYYSVAVIGVNTSALIESGIVGRPVYTMKVPEFSGTQEGTLHFQHLKHVNGGLLTMAETLDEHHAQLAAFLNAPDNSGDRGRAFIEAFIRPHGLDQPAAPRFADAVESVAATRPPVTGPPSLMTRAIRRLLLPTALIAQRASAKRSPTTDTEREPSRPRRLLFVMGSPEYLRFYDATIRELAAAGNRMLLAVNMQKDVKQARLDQFCVETPNVELLGLVPPRSDRWARLAEAVRGTMDFVRYLDVRFAGTPVLRARMKRKCLPKSLHVLDRIQTMPTPRVNRVLRMLRAIENAIPVSDSVRSFVQAAEPDAVLVTPLVDAASDQVDVVRAAASLGVPTAACIASWDNLTNKGLLRVTPDLVTVWNSHQVTEAVDLHGIPRERVVVTGAQPFDRWFEKTPSRTRAEFCEMLALDPAKPIVLFTGSSFFISGENTEVPFVRRWMEALRAHHAELVATANVLVRPHPYNADQWARADVADLGPAAIFPKGRHNPTQEQNRTDFYDSMYHCDAVVGVNTSAMIEAAIVGRPVHAVLTPDFADTQEGTIHFRYLLPENGGFLRVAPTFELHLQQLEASLADTTTTREETARFVATFIRPLDIKQPAVPLLARALQDLAARPRSAPGAAGVGRRLLRALLAVPVFLWSMPSSARKVKTLSVRKVKPLSVRKQLRTTMHHGRKRLRFVTSRGIGLVAATPRGVRKRLRLVAKRGFSLVAGTPRGVRKRLRLVAKRGFSFVAGAPRGVRKRARRTAEIIARNSKVARNRARKQARLLRHRASRVAEIGTRDWQVTQDRVRKKTRLLRHVFLNGYRRAHRVGEYVDRNVRVGLDRFNKLGRRSARSTIRRALGTSTVVVTIASSSPHAVARWTKQTIKTSRHVGREARRRLSRTKRRIMRRAIPPVARQRKRSGRSGPLTILFSLRNLWYVKHYESVLRQMAAHGHEIVVVVEPLEKNSPDWEDAAQRLQADCPSINFVSVSRNDDEWLDFATRLRWGIDYLRFLHPLYDRAPKLRERAAAEAPPSLVRVTRWPGLATRPAVRALQGALSLADSAVPVAANIEEFLRHVDPDVVILSPLIALGTTQLDVLRAAKRSGYRTIVSVGSWDHLSSKALIRVLPDRVFVWNHTQRDEAIRLHRVPASRVVVTGAQAFDDWFSWQPRARTEFLQRVGLPPEKPYILYVCSALIDAKPNEAEFVRRWVDALRADGNPVVRDASILIRPHPKRDIEFDHVDFSSLDRVAIWPRGGVGPVVPEAKADYFDSIYHSAAVVGLNTSAFIEAAIIDRPVHALLLPEFWDSQEGTIHFHYLLNEGVLRIARDMPAHLDQLRESLVGEAETSARNRAFVDRFVSAGAGRGAATENFVAAVEQLAALPAPAREHGAMIHRPLRALLYPAALAVFRTSPRAERERRRLVFAERARQRAEQKRHKRALRAVRIADLHRRKAETNRRAELERQQALELHRQRKVEAARARAAEMAETNRRKELARAEKARQKEEETRLKIIAREARIAAEQQRRQEAAEQKQRERAEILAQHRAEKRAKKAAAKTSTDAEPPGADDSVPQRPS